MKQLRTNFSLRLFREDLHFTKAALAAHALTQDLAATVEDFLKGWAAVEAKEWGVVAEGVERHAELAIRDGDLDAKVMHLSRELHTLVGGNRTDRRWTAVFSERPSLFIKRGYADEAQRAKALKQVLVEVGLTSLSGLGQELEALGLAVQSALANRDEAGRKRGVVRYEIDSWKESANRLRISLHGELSKRGAANSLPRDFADHFFAASQPEDGAGEQAAKATHPADGAELS